MPGRAWRYVITNEKIIAKQDMQWKLIPKLAPWMGVFNERLVGVTIRASEKPYALSFKLLQNIKLSLLHFHPSPPIPLSFLKKDASLKRYLEASMSQLSFC